MQQLHCLIKNSKNYKWRKISVKKIGNIFKKIFYDAKKPKEDMPGCDTILVNKEEATVTEERKKVELPKEVSETKEQGVITEQEVIIEQKDEKQEKSKNENARVEPIIPAAPTELTIVLYENSEEVKYYEKFFRENIVKHRSKTGKVLLIQYGDRVIKSDMFDVAELETRSFFDEKPVTDQKNFYEALMCLSDTINEQYAKMFRHPRRKNAQIIVEGIGTGSDNVGKISKEEALKNFAETLKKCSDVETKYVCLSEQNVQDAAETGFHYIRVIPRRKG